MEVHPLDSIINHYLFDKDITKGTFELYHTILTQYAGYLKQHGVIYAKMSDVMNYLDWKRSKGYSTRWIYHQISAIKGLYQYLSLNYKRLDLSDEYAIDITESIKNERIKKNTSKPILTIKQAKHLIICLKNKRKYIWQYRDYAMIFLMITTGLRSIEIRRARKKDVRLRNDQLLLYVHGKGRHSTDEFVKITPLVQEAIDDYLHKRKDKNPYLFISHSHRTNIPYLSRTFFIGMFKRVLKDCDLQHTKITPHSLRHAAATFNLLRGGSLEATSKFMRHSDMSSTLVYAHHINRMKDDSENQLEAYILKEDR